MPELMPKSEIKSIIRETLEGQPIGLKIDDDKSPNIVYPYVLLPIGNNLKSIKAGAHGLAHMYHDIFDNMDVTTAAFPEAKSWPYLLEFCGLTNLRFITPNKKDVNIPGQIEMMCGTAYKGKSPMFDPYIGEKDERLLIVDDTISSGDTQEGCVEGYEEAGTGVVGGIAVYERGSGVDELHKKFESYEKRFAGFARMDIVPKEDYEKGLIEEFGTEDYDELSREYVKHLYKNYFIRGDKSWFERLNDRFEVRCTSFYDE